MKQTNKQTERKLSMGERYADIISEDRKVAEALRAPKAVLNSIKRGQAASILAEVDKSDTTALSAFAARVPRGPWTLHKLDENEKWSAGVNGPRVYLQCDELTAKLIVRAVNHADKLAETLRELRDFVINIIEENAEPNLEQCVDARETANTALAAYEEAQ